MCETILKVTIVVGIRFHAFLVFCNYTHVGSQLHVCRRHTWLTQSTLKIAAAATMSYPLVN